MLSIWPTPRVTLRSMRRQCTLYRWVSRVHISTCETGNIAAFQILAFTRRVDFPIPFVGFRLDAFALITPCQVLLIVRVGLTERTDGSSPCSRILYPASNSSSSGSANSHQRLPSCNPFQPFLLPRGRVIVTNTSLRGVKLNDGSCTGPNAQGHIRDSCI
jgi:hypothetical protein